MGERELEVLDEELLDVWAANIVGLLDLDNLEDLQSVNEARKAAVGSRHT